MNVRDGSDTGTIAVSLQLKDVDQPVTITAPSSGRPIEELLRRLEQDFGRGGGSSAGAAESTVS